MILLHIGNCFPFTEIDDVENRKMTRVCAILMANVYHLNILSRAELMKGFEDSEDLFELVK